MGDSSKSIFDLSRETHLAFERWMQNPQSAEAEQLYYQLEAEYKRAIVEQYRPSNGNARR